MSKTFSIDFKLPESANDLAPYIGIGAELFDKVVSATDRTQFYAHERIPKRGQHNVGKFRDVWQVADQRLTRAHKAIARRFGLFAHKEDPRFPHAAAYGYVRNRGTRDNAGVHCGAPLLLRADIRNFFPSISINRLKKRFLELRMHPAAADALAKFVTIDGHLPLGLNASPMLANLVCVDLDIKFEKLAQAYGCKYTRYADDIAISGKRKLPSKAELEKILNQEGFQLNSQKFRQTKLGQAHYVTGLSVSDVNGPHIPRQMKRRLRQELHYIKKFGMDGHLSRIGEATFQSGINRLDGTINYMRHIETRISQRLKSQWEELLEKNEAVASYYPLVSRSSPSVFCFVDETEIAFGNRKFLALGLAFTEDLDELSASTIATLRDHQVADPFYAGDKTALAKRGLHFTDSHPDLRTAYIKVLSVLPYRVFVIFAELISDDKYQDIYVSLLNKVLPRRLMHYDRAAVRFIFEENSKIKMPVLEQAVSDAYLALEKANNRRPVEKSKVIVGKKLDQPCFAVPDYLLAVFARFAQTNEKPAEKNIRTLQFERLRDMYRLIIDADTGVEYSRRRPFQPWAVADK
ncbi:MAG: reverse transcriptase family protein [Afipia sp.]|nr:reverse transcriptase family protein [Afipia sp.]